MVTEVTEVTTVVVAVDTDLDLPRLAEAHPAEVPRPRVRTQTAAREAAVPHLVLIDDLKRDKDLTRVKLSSFIFA